MRDLIPFIQRYFRKETSQSNDVVFDKSKYEILYECDKTLILQNALDGDRCIVSFTGVGHGMGGIDIQSPEFSKNNLENKNIFVIDKTRSWGNRLDLKSIVKIVSDVSGKREVVTLGNSMGGFLAILFAQHLDAREVIAFSPQWSLDPRVVPLETRWSKYQSNIEEFHYADLSSSIDAKRKYLIIFGGNLGDQYHKGFFDQHSNILNGGQMATIKIRESDHNVAKMLNEKRVLYPIIDGFIDGANVCDILRNAGVDFETNWGES